MNRTTMDGFVKTHFGNVLEADGQIVCGSASINTSSILTKLIQEAGRLSPGHICLDSGSQVLMMRSPSSTITPTTDIFLPMSTGPSGGWISMWM